MTTYLSNKQRVILLTNTSIQREQIRQLYPQNMLIISSALLAWGFLLE